MKNKGKMSPPKEDNKLPITGPKQMEIQKLPNKEFKIIVTRTLRELQKNIDKQFYLYMKTKEQNEKFNI